MREFGPGYFCATRRYPRKGKVWTLEEECWVRGGWCPVGVLLPHCDQGSTCSEALRSRLPVARSQTRQSTIASHIAVIGEGPVSSRITAASHSQAVKAGQRWGLGVSQEEETRRCWVQRKARFGGGCVKMARSDESVWRSALYISVYEMVERKTQARSRAARDWKLGREN